MKIEQSTQAINTQPVKKTRGPSGEKAGKTPEALELSHLASQLLDSGNELPFDAGRVAEIKEAISKGKFSVNANAIADRLIASARELADSRHQS
jgi:negative regulator of flagellin synthesis FlgM